MNQEYFAVELSGSINLGLPLSDIGTVAQIEQKDICIVPGVAPFWYGVANFKGSLLWILDSDRFLNLETNRDRPSETLTAVVLTQEIEGNQRRIALVVKQLRGILTVESGKLKPLTSSVASALQNSCTATIAIEDQDTYILNSTAFLRQLHEQSTLVSV
jgi:twitching motility protein PilI